MDFNKAFFLKKEDSKPRWRVIDAQGQHLGRLATAVADALRGKTEPHYTPHTDSGDYVVITNAAKVVLTGKKMEQKEYARYTGWMGGYKTITAKDLLAKFPDRLIQYAVRGMLPKNKTNKHMMRKLKVYAGSEHPHAAQMAAKSE